MESYLDCHGEEDQQGEGQGEEEAVTPPLLPRPAGGIACTDLSPRSYDRGISVDPSQSELAFASTIRLDGPPVPNPWSGASGSSRALHRSISFRCIRASAPSPRTPHRGQPDKRDPSHRH